MCPYCGETSELTFEDEGWSRQSYVQDCPVCCQPWDVEDGGRVVWSAAACTRGRAGAARKR
ncbi:MAG: CPXCG motif-containing cysteine-rich protein [Acidobacteria bacterium]|nr:MAG: CPXCG motif-containing cysteine-rich protein [Acidobacteriota bacterium]